MELANSTNFPDAKFLGNFENGSPEWHEVRRHGIGGSEIGTIMGLNPWESAYALWAKKCGLIEDSFKGNVATEVGNWLEGPIIERFAKLHPELEVFEAGTYASKAVTFLHANPDALARHRETGEWFVIEAKTSSNYWDSVPASYIAQIQHYMDVMNIKKAYVIGLVAMKPFEQLFEADEFQQSIQRDYAIKFWGKMQTQQAPDWDGSDSTYQAVRQMHPLIEDRDVEVGEFGINLWNAQQRADAAQAELNEYKSQLLDFMGYAKHATVTVDGQPPVRVASRQIRGGLPTLIIHRKGK